MMSIRYAKLLFISITAAFLLCACGRQADTSGAKTPPKVVYTKPVVRDIVLWDDYTAKIEAIASVNIRAQVGGYLKSINFKEGENVEKGDLLFVIDPRPYEAALASAEAELAEAKARVELAKTNLERAKELYAADVVAKELLDTRNCEMLSSNAVLASAEAKVRNAKLNLEYTSIRAPMSGKISEALVDIGNLIVADSTLLTRIVDDSSVQAYFELSERDVVAYRDCGLFNKIDIKAGTGPTVDLRLFEHKNKTYNGVLNYYDNEISSESASLTMRADFDNSKRQLSPGMYGTISVPGYTVKNAILVPDTAIGTDLVSRYVMTIGDDNKVKYNPVEVGRLVGKYAIVTSGVTPSDRIVVSGLHRAAPGILVEPVEEVSKEK